MNTRLVTKTICSLSLLVFAANCSSHSGSSGAPGVAKNELVYTLVETQGAAHSATNLEPRTLVLTKSDIAQLEPVKSGATQIGVSLTPEGQKKMIHFFANKVGSKITWEACGFRSAPIPVNSPITGNNQTIAVPAGFTLACLK